MIAKVKIHDKYAFAFVKIVCTFARLNPYKELSMKRLTVMFFILLAIVSCKKNEPPTISVSPATATLTTDGGTVNATVTAGGTWTATCSTASVTISPASAQGNSPVSISVPANTTGMSRTIEAIFTCTDGGNNTTVKISQEFYEEAISLKFSENHKENWDFEGGVEEITVECNYPWTSKASGTITVSPTSGEKGTTKVTVTIPKNEGTTEAESSLEFTVKNVTETKKVTLAYSVMAPYLTYGDATYPLVKLKDGNIWMAENLRYVPQGKTVSDDMTALDNGIWYPIKVNEAGNGGEFDKSESGIKAKGYLYTTATAFGVARGTITEANATSFEGCQGICPEGWHLPTVTEMVNLVGKCNNGTLTNPNAPYYDATLASPNGSIPMLEADKWPVNSAVAGMVSVANETATTGTIAGVTGTAPNKKLNTGYFAGSSFYKKTTNNIQFYGLMPNVSNGTISAAYLNMTFGVSVRCVKDAKKTE